MSAGIETCQALKMGSGFSWELHVDAIRGLDFEGATGRVQFGNAELDPDRLGTRLASTVTFCAYNVRIEEVSPSNFSSSLVLTVLRLPVRDPHRWKTVHDSVYCGGRTLLPLLLRDEPEKNFLSRPLQALGLSLMVFAAAASVARGLWVFVYREHRVLKVSQPPFLYLVCLGTLVLAMASLQYLSMKVTGGRRISLGRRVWPRRGCCRSEQSSYTGLCSRNCFD